MKQDRGLQPPDRDEPEYDIVEKTVETVRMLDLLPEHVFKESSLIVWAMANDFTRIETAIEFADWCQLRAEIPSTKSWDKFVDYKLKNK